MTWLFIVMKRLENCDSQFSLYLIVLMHCTELTEGVARPPAFSGPELSVLQFAVLQFGPAVAALSTTAVNQTTL